MPSKKLSLSDLGSVRDQFPQDTTQPLPKIGKQSNRKNELEAWQTPSRHKVPLQVLKLDDFSVLGSSSDESYYSKIFGWKSTLEDLLEIAAFNERIEELHHLAKSEKDKGFKKVLERLGRNQQGNSAHFSAIRDELSKLDDQRIRYVLERAAKADEYWQPLYDGLCQRIELLACNITNDEGNLTKAVITVDFPWRVRVGGFQGFRERLLPALHPVYGIPYVPASSIKGMILAWAKNHINSSDEIDRLLGFLRGKKASIAAVEVLDAFPMKPSISADVATPQWAENLSYSPAPHQLLSLRDLKLKIGLTHTSRGSQHDVKTVVDWLGQSLLENGLGSRISAGYGRANQVNGAVQLIRTQEPYEQVYSFEFWSQGMYGATPPSLENNYQGEMEFRPSAVRGVLRYWFRAIALGLYSQEDARRLEQIIFGTIEPRAVLGTVQISTHVDEEIGDYNLHFVKGTIAISSKNVEHMKLMSKVLELASHLGGMGRGSRRPLHWNDGMRGCYWELQGDISPLPCNRTSWCDFLSNSSDSIQSIFRSVQTFSRPGIGDPGTPENRRQDVLNRNSRIYLVEALPSQGKPMLEHPRDIQSWETEGLRSSVRGPALNLLYGNKNFKGVNRNGDGKATVGGKLGTPSYIIIQSNFPKTGNPYQCVTVFGVDNRDRQAFANALTNAISIEF